MNGDTIGCGGAPVEDLTVYDLAERVRDGFPVSSAARREVFAMVCETTATLWRNLAIAGGLCAAYTCGWDQRADLACYERGQISAATMQHRRWHPLCGRQYP